MEPLFSQLTNLLLSLWWPFCRILALFSAAPMIGETMVPVSVRVLLSLCLAVVLLPAAQPPALGEVWSLQTVLLTAEQVIIGLMLGLAFHFILAALMTLGFLISAQMGLSMAIMNDPMSGMSSDVISALLYVFYILVFFAIDGHLIFTGVLSESFRAWPIGSGLPAALLHGLALNVAWVFAAAVLMAVPIIFAMLVVQMGFGFLNRVAPTLNLFSLGFSLFTLFGLFLLGWMARGLPEHYLRMTRRILEMINHSMHAVPHG